MQMSPISLDTPSASTPSGDPAGAGEGGERFADQLVQAQAGLPPGHNLAAAGLTLRTLTLGPALEVLTSSSGNPDGDSLAEFAKAQGLDEDVVAWLFSDATQAQIQAQTLIPIAIQTPPGVMALPGTTAGPAVSPGAAALVTPTLQTGAPDGEVTLPVQTVPAGEADGLALAAVSTANWLQSQQAAWSAKDAKAPATPAAIDPAQVPVPSPLLAVAVATARSARPDATSLLASAVTQNTDVPVEILSLDLQPELESLWDNSDAGAGHSDSHRPGTGHPTHAGDTTSAANQAPAGDDGLPTTTLAQRAAAYQELSQRLGEALAQRVMSQIERGNWEVRLLLKPAKLGEVEIDLALRSGALDASFRTTNPLTRDLLNDGLPRLREVLANAGMDIAGLNVGSGRNQQTGGNPTPRHARESQGTENADPGVVATSAPAMQTRLRGPGDGWDVLV
jgi:hypothetical protein